MNKPYREGTSLEDILDDGWARGFHSSQTLKEAKQMGFVLTLETLLASWAAKDKELDDYIATCEKGGGDGE